MKTYLAALLALSCGTTYPEEQGGQKKATKQEASSKETEDADQKAKDEETKKKALEIAGDQHNGDNNNISVQTNIALCSDVLKAELIKRPAFYFMMKAKSYYQAISEAPAGYRMPERWELIKALDGGFLTDYPSLSTVWTKGEHTVNGSNYAWGYQGGQTNEYNVLNALVTLYIKE